MAKRKDTLEIEQALADMCKEKRIYGCEEVTIGFYNNGHGNEVVDFITMDSKGIIRCYEIKVTLSDLKSSAKKSWYGHYNYLVVSKELFDKVDDWKTYLPDGVGLVVFYGNKSIRLQGQFFSYASFNTVFKPKKKNISKEIEIMLKESMVRSMYYKINKYKDANNLEKHKELVKEAHEHKKQFESEHKEKERLQMLINQFLWARRRLTGNSVYFEDIVESMCDQARKIKRKDKKRR